MKKNDLEESKRINQENWNGIDQRKHGWAGGKLFYISSHRIGQNQMTGVLKSGMWHFWREIFQEIFSLKEKIWKNLPNGFKLLKFWEPVLFQGHRVKSGKPNYLL